MRVAAIDLGSNSFHMLISEILGPHSFETVLQEKMMIQLGRTALVTGRLDSDAMKRGLRCLREFRALALARRVERTLAVATSAIREAQNGEDFIRRARDESGIAVRVITGREEGRLIHLAVTKQVDLRSERALLIDVGGGSLELTVGDAGKIYYSTSLKLGFLRLHGRFVTTDPITKREACAITEFVRGSLKSSVATIRRRASGRIIATSGTMTTLLRLAQQCRNASPSRGAAADVVSRDEIRAMMPELLRVPTVERVKKFDLDPLRAEYLPAALLCFDAILEEVGAKEITVCPVALREGLLYDFMSRARPVAHAPQMAGDLRLQAVFDLASRCDYPADHSQKVADLAVQIFRQTSNFHGLGESEVRLLEYGAILHDIGYHIGYAKHHRHAYYLVMNCDLRGFTPEERSILANIVRYHRRAVPRTTHAPFGELSARARKVVKYLSSILRIADALDQSHFSLIEEVKCIPGKGKLHFQALTKARHSSVELDLERAKNHARYFEKLFDVETIFTARKSAPAVRPGSQAPAPSGLS